MKQLDKCIIQKTDLENYIQKKAVADLAESKVIDRMNYVIRKMWELCKCKLDWWEVSNPDPEYSSGVKIKFQGEFISYHYEGNYGKDELCIIDKNGDEIGLMDSFPSRWLWEDFEDEVTNGINLYKEKLEATYAKIFQAKEAARLKKQKLLESVKSKLTKEELRLLKNG